MLLSQFAPALRNGWRTLREHSFRTASPRPTTQKSDAKRACKRQTPRLEHVFEGIGLLADAVQDVQPGHGPPECLGQLGTGGRNGQSFNKRGIRGSHQLNSEPCSWS